MHNAGVFKGYQHETDIRNEVAAYVATLTAIGTVHLIC